jgi:hypothetical protein
LIFPGCPIGIGKDYIMLQLEPGTVLEKEYKGKKIKVKVLKDGTFLYDSKNYEDRGSLIKAITKGKTAQFTTFFGLSTKDDVDKPKKVKKVLTNVVDEDMDVSVASGSIDSLIRLIVKDELKSLLSSFRERN